MLVTPVQPKNSLNNLIPNKQQPPSFDQKNNSKISYIGSPLKKVATTARKKFKPKNGGSLTLVKKKILLEQKLEETKRRNADQRIQSIEEHKEDLIQRKQMHAAILQEYEQISKDKNVLTAEIKNMKRYLSDITTKLDQSLSVLSKNTTLFALKKGLANQVLTVSNRTGTRAKRLKKPKRSILKKGSVVKNASISLKVK